MKFEYKVSFNAEELDIIIIALTIFTERLENNESRKGYLCKTFELRQKFNEIERVQNLLELDEDKAFWQERAFEEDQEEENAVQTVFK